MALALLDGTTAAVDAAFDVDGAGATATASLKCMFRSLVVDIQQDSFSYVTFCSANWEENRASIKRAVFGMTGYVGKGVTYAAPGSLMSATVAAATLTFTFDTSCTIVFNPLFKSDQNAINAFGDSARAVSGVSNGAVTVAWVVS